MYQAKLAGKNRYHLFDAESGALEFLFDMSLHEHRRFPDLPCQKAAGERGVDLVAEFPVIGHRGHFAGGRDGFPSRGVRVDHGDQFQQ